MKDQKNIVEALTENQTLRLNKTREEIEEMTPEYKDTRAIFYYEVVKMLLTVKAYAATDDEEFYKYYEEAKASLEETIEMIDNLVQTRRKIGK